MTISLRQETVAFGASATASSVVSNALPSPALVGSVIEVWIAYDNSSNEISTVVDSASQSYTLVGSTVDVTDTSVLALYALNNNTSNTALVVTCTFTGTPASRNIHVREITGAKNQAPDTSSFPARIAAPGTATNAITIPLTSSGQPSLISGVVCAVAGAGAIVAGSGFTGTTHFATGFGFGSSLFESARVTGTGSHPANWTDATNGGTSAYLGGAVIWDESPTASKQLLLLSSNQGGF